MNATTSLGLGVLLLASLTPICLDGRSPAPTFAGDVTGEITAHLTGEARFGAVERPESGSAVFTVSLGAYGEEGSILFSRNGAALEVGTYTISDEPRGPDEVRALVTTGSATRPTGVFRGHSGELVITAVTETTMTGTFDVSGRGFLAAAPDLDDRSLTANGWFQASRD